MAKSGENEESGRDGVVSTATATRRAAKDSDDMADSAHDSTPGRAPAFQFYPRDFLSDRNVVLMTMQERGVYITLICFAWEGPLPTDAAALAKLCGMRLAAFKQCWETVSLCFRERNGVLIHPRVEREREKQAAYREQQSNKGKASGRARRKRTAVKPRLNRGSVSVPTEREPNVNREATLILSSSSSSSLSSELHTGAKEPAPAEWDVDEDLGDGGITGKDVGKFITRFCELYSKHRHGAKFFVKRTQHVPLVRQLLRIYDARRLEKMTVVLLTTDQEWVKDTDRGIGILSIKASWLDGLLAEYEAQHGEIRVAS